MTETAAGLAIGTEFAGYRVDSVLGRGGMGAVYLATHLRLGRRAALKVLLPAYAEDDGFRERFIRESQLAASLDHPNIVSIFDAGEEQGVLYLAMQYVQGHDLRTELDRRGALDPAGAAIIVNQAASALDAAHKTGLVHRDVKPANILIGEPQGWVYLTDFGVAKQVSAPGLTRTGLFIGTVDYCSPEQIEGRGVDSRADVYALGCVLFECLTGRRPYVKDSDVAVIHAHLLEPPPPLSSLRPDMPAELDNVIATAMAKDRERRYGTCMLLAQALTKAATQPGGGAARTVPAAGLTVPATVVPGEKTLVPVPSDVVAPDVDQAVQSPPTAPPVEPPPLEPPPEPPRRKRRLVKPLAIVGVLLAAAAAVAGFFLLRGNGGADGVVLAPSVPGGPALAVVDGSVFLTIPNGRVLRLAPKSLAIESAATHSPRPRAIAGASKRVVVADDAVLTALRTKNLAPVAAMRFGPDPLAAAGAGQVVAAHRKGPSRGRVCIVGSTSPGPCAEFGFAPTGLGISPDGQILVADGGGETILPISLEGGTVVLGSSLAVRGQPRGALVDLPPNLYTAVANGVGVVDFVARKPLPTISLGETPSGICVVPTTGRLFAALPRAGEVVVLDATSPGAKPQRVKVGRRPQALACGVIAGQQAVVVVANTGDATVMRLDPLTGKVLSSKPIPALRARPAAAPVLGRVSFDKAGSNVTATLGLRRGTLDPEGLVVRDTSIGDGRAAVELWQGGISTPIDEKGSDGLTIQIRPAPGHLVVAALARPKAFRGFKARRGADGRSVVLTLAKTPKPVTTKPPPPPPVTTTPPPPPPVTTTPPPPPPVTTTPPPPPPVTTTPPPPPPATTTPPPPPPATTTPPPPPPATTTPPPPPPATTTPPPPPPATTTPPPPPPATTTPSIG